MVMEAEAALKLGAGRGVLTKALLFGAMVAGGQMAAAQKVTPVPNLDPKRLAGTWFEISRYPTKWEKRCAAQATVLFAEGDKKRAIQMGTFCPGKNGSEQEYTNTGKIDKKANGEIKFGFIWPFTTKYWVIALAPDYSWLVASQPKRKTLSILSKTPQMDPATLSMIGGLAEAQGFKLDKLVSLPKLGKTYKAKDGELKVTPPAPAAAKP